MKQLTEKNKSERISNIIFWVTEITFIFSVFYVLYKVIVTPTSPTGEFDKARSDYILMLLQSIAGLIVINIPSILAKRVKIQIPSFMNIMYILFLYAAVYLGEVRYFYYRVPFWDTILHFMSAIMLGCLAFSVLNALSNNNVLHVSPWLLMVFSFCFAVTMEVIWEFYEFAWDHFLGLNMQKYMTEDGVLLVGHEVLIDTITDLAVGALGALIASVLGYLSLKKSKKFVESTIFTKIEE